MACACAIVPWPLGWTINAEAHQGDRIFPIYEITDDMLQLIDLKDGRIDEWEELFEPSLTTLDFTASSDRVIAPFDPSDIDFRIWLGWNGTHSRVYVAIQAADDSYMVRVKFPQVEDYLSLNVDGDHSGGRYQFFSGPRYRDSFGHAQRYIAPSLWDLDRSVGLLHDPEGLEWVNYPPYIDGGVGAVGENPVFWNVEFYVTPFDALIWNDQERSVVSELVAGKVIGFFIRVVDLDADLSKPVGYSIDDGFVRRTASNPAEDADSFVDGLLLGAGEFMEGSAVQPSSWGLIKASFKETIKAP